MDNRPMSVLVHRCTNLRRDAAPEGRSCENHRKEKYFPVALPLKLLKVDDPDVGLSAYLDIANTTDKPEGPRLKSEVADAARDDACPYDSAHQIRQDDGHQ